ncbi:hypothetical protein OC861_005115 [Tilletia horrida]|nr:hypothetical protein OC861_005115 [Tilletia horrida]
MDKRNSYKGYSAADAYAFGSAADAYATPPASDPKRYSQQRQLEQQRASVYSTGGMTVSTSAGAFSNYGQKAAPPSAGTSAAQARKAWAPVAEEDDDDEEDDDNDDNHWNVYDDFNNARPHAAATGQEQENPYAHPADPSRTSLSSPGLGTPSGTAAYQTAPLGAIPRSGTNQTLSGFGQGRQSLLPREAFGFDVQNSDPRSIKVDPFGTPQGETPSSATDRMGAFLNEKRTSGYQNLADQEPGLGHDRSQNTTGIELVTVPALGTEFSKEEMKGMGRAQKRKAKINKRKKKVSKWASGEEKIFGLVDRRVFMIGTFVGLIILALLLYFVIPRVPSIAFLTATPLDPVPNASGMKIGGPPANFSMDMLLNLRADNTAGFIPTRASRITVEVTDLTTGAKVGKGSMSDRSFNGRTKTVFQMPVHFQYVSNNLTGDATWQLWHLACGPIYPNTPRPTLTLSVAMTMHVAGLLGSHQTGTQLNNLKCPFVLQRDQ